MAVSQRYPNPTNQMLLIADVDEVAGILVTGDGSGRVGRCLSRGAVAAYQSLFFHDDTERHDVDAAVERAFLALNPDHDAGDESVAGATRVSTFARDFMDFVEATGVIELAPEPAELGELRQRSVAEREEVQVGARQAPLDPGILSERQIGRQTVSFHRADYTFPTGIIAVDDSISMTGGDPSVIKRFNGGLGVSGCTACGICGGCAACTLCAEINFAVAAGYLVAVDFAIHLL